jgi:hypothetical protein
LPTAIIGAVNPVVVNSINGKSVRVAVTECPLFKFREVVFPFVTNDNTFAPVMRITWFFGIVATLFHATPD